MKQDLSQRPCWYLCFMSEWMTLNHCKSEELLADLRIKRSALAEPLSMSTATYEQDSP